MNCYLVFLAVLLLSPPAAMRAVEPDGKSATHIPRQGLALWLTAQDAVVENGDVRLIKDRSDNRNDAVREKDPKIVTGNPMVVTNGESGQPVLRFSGAYTGYEFNSITNIRTVFMVVSKHPDAFKKFAERFVLAGRDKAEVDFHVGCHWTDVISENWPAKKGKAWFNGFECVPAVSEFSTKLAVISMAANTNLVASQLARDRDFKDRSWYGDIGELIIYTTQLSDADRQTVENHLLKKYNITPFKPLVVPLDSVLPGHTKPPAGGAK
jgi:hypothetical protein